MRLTAVEVHDLTDISVPFTRHFRLDDLEGEKNVE